MEQFPLKRRDGSRRQSYCRACKAVYQRRWYERNRERHIDAVNTRRRELGRANRAYLNLVKTRPCADCGGRFPPYVMDFDHVRGEKRWNLSASVRRVSPEELAAEVDKCDVVCANCHRLRTYGRYDNTTSPPDASEGTEGHNQFDA
ncbi:hypothetical protein ER308_03445 [Egibacter rhizosphaerae]|uniref:HNH endonuclease n=1 Tax=Egibacter rhizosphaerae TaxID=1670831 RepID=A0A411YBW9_9ACTN|nr:hypothetical protein [Egibacter rhizosphaerae]QBI18700.1 hypothetical protein ER308_03445 [Egibacter rhizosphaerae]